MRIAIFAETFLPKWDGITNTICHLLEYLDRRGHASLMFAPRGAPGEYARTPIAGLPGIRFPLYPELRLVFPTVDVRRELRAFRPDVMHVISPVSLGWAGLRHARDLGIPVVASYHTDIPGYASRYGLDALQEPLWHYFRWLHNQADLTVCPSHFTQAQLVRHGFENVKVWGRGVDTDRFSPRWRDETWRRRLSASDPGAPLLLYVGRLAVEKRIDWLRPLLDALPWVNLAIVGDGPMRAHLESVFAGTRTTFTGYLQGEDLSRAFASADVFAFPSANETFGNVVLEAMASGLAVLAPRSGGLVDHVDHGRNGLLFNPDSVASFVSQGRRLALDPAYARRLGGTARRYAQSQTWDTVLDDLLDSYGDTAAARAGHRAPAGHGLPQRASSGVAAIRQLLEQRI